MSNSAAFDFAVTELARTTGLDRAAARGTLRGVLEQALFAPRSVTASQLRMVIERLLAAEIRRGGVADPEGVCRQLAARLAAEPFGASDPESADEIFSRLIRR